MANNEQEKVKDPEREKEREKDKRKKNKMGYMIIALIISVFIWGMVSYTTDPDVSKTLHDVPVRVVGEDTLKERGLIVTGTDDIPDLSVKISGKRSDMIYAIDNVVIEIDVSDITSTGDYELEGSVVLPNSRINLERIRFDRVPITVSEYEEKEISISIRQTGTLKNKLVRSESDMKTVLISGSKEEVEKVAGGYAAVDLTKIQESGEQRASFVLTDSDGNLISRNETIETETPEIIIENTVYDSAELRVEPVLSDTLSGLYMLDAENTTADPQTVTVGLLEGYSYESVKAVITERAAGEYRLTEEKGMYIPDESAYVYVAPKTYSLAGVELSLPVTVRGLGTGLMVEGAPMVDASFYGDAAGAEGLTAYVDASGLTAGTYGLPVSFEGGELYPRGEYTAEVTIAG